MCRQLGLDIGILHLHALEVLVLGDYIHTSRVRQSEQSSLVHFAQGRQAESSFNVGDLVLVDFYLLTCPRQQHFDSLTLSSIWLPVQFAAGVPLMHRSFKLPYPIKLYT